MSLDVTLFSERVMENAPSTGVFIREDGVRRELSEAEVLEKWPDWVPQLIESEPSREIFSRNITHNLTTMADHAGLYKPLWRPEEIGITKAEQLIKPLQQGLNALLIDPDRFRAFNPKNGWGSYEGLVAFVEAYLQACIENPTASVHADR